MRERDLRAPALPGPPAGDRPESPAPAAAPGAALAADDAALPAALRTPALVRWWTLALAAAAVDALLAVRAVRAAGAAPRAPAAAPPPLHAHPARGAHRRAPRHPPSTEPAMTPADQITAWKTATPNHSFATAGPAARGDHALVADPAGAAEVPRVVAGAGLFDLEFRPQRSEYLFTLGCCQGFTTDATACSITSAMCFSVHCVNPLTLV